MYKFHGLRLRTKVLKSVFPFYVFPFVRLFSSSCSLSLTLFRGGLLGLIFAGYVPLASQSPYPTRVYSVANYRPHLVTFGQICNFRDPRLVTFYFYELTHFLDWMKNTLLFICSTNILVRLLTGNMKDSLTPKNPKMCDPILVTLLKMRPHPAAHPHYQYMVRNFLSFVILVIWK